LRHIIANGSDAQRDKALQTTHFSDQFREKRAGVQEKAAVTAAMVASPVGGKMRSVYTAEFKADLPGRLVRQEGGLPTNDPASDEAYDGAGATYDLFSEVYQRNSIDGSGMHLNSTVHYQQGYDNAFWNGQQMVYGDGDEDMPANQRLFNRFTIALDVIGHELTHGVTQATANLVYMNQPGALNESFSDIFGSLVKQRQKGQLAKDADWIIGEGLFSSNVRGVGLRSMKAPGTAYDDPVLGKDPQPAHMQNYVNTTDDNGGVHINSGIPNHAFYLTAQEIGGFAWEKTGKIWYTTLATQVTSNINFLDMANLTLAVAGQLYGSNSVEQHAVRKAWNSVGIALLETSNPNPGCMPGVLKLFKGG